MVNWVIGLLVSGADFRQGK